MRGFSLAVQKLNQVILLSEEHQSHRAKLDHVTSPGPPLHQQLPLPTTHTALPKAAI
jgi:hypothetical protein